MSNKFATALKPERRGAAADVPGAVANAPASPHERSSRKATKHIGGYFDPIVSKQLRHIALEEDSSVQALLGEALDLLFQSRRKPTIAQKSAE
jgi:hypothetical protein